MTGAANPRLPWPRLRTSELLLIQQAMQEAQGM
jgi:hypothetical protein